MTALLTPNRLVLLLSALLLAGCAGFDEEEELGPAPLTDFEEERELDRVWSRGIGDGQGELYNRLVPVVYGDHIIAAGVEGDVKMLGLERGRKTWSVDIDRRLSGAVGTDGQRVYLGTLEGTVVALDFASGDELWQADVSGEVLAPPQSNGNVVVVQTFDGHLYGLDPASGERRWSYNVTVPVLTLRGTSTPVFYEGMVLAGFANGKVAAVDAADGTLLWESRVGAPTGATEIERLVDVDAPLMISQNLLFAVSYQGQVVAIDPRSGRRLWARDASSYVQMAEGFGNIYVVGAEGSIMAIARNGQGVRWEQTVLARRQLSGAVTWGSYVVVGDFEGYVHLLSQADGHLVARKKVDGDGIRVAPLVEGNRLYVYGNSGKLAVFELEAE